MSDLKFAENYYIRVLLNKLKLKDIMVTQVLTGFENDSVSAVETKMREHKIRHLPIVDLSQKLVGLLTQRDLFRIQSPRRDDDGNWYYDKAVLDGYILKYIMIRAPFTLTPEATVAEAVLAMSEKKYGCIPVVDRDKILKGIITQADILKLAVKILKEE